MAQKVNNDGTIEILEDLNYFNDFEMSGTKHIKLAGPPPADETQDELPSSFDPRVLNKLPQSTP